MWNERKFIKEDGPRTRPYDQLWKSSLTGILIILFLLWQRPPGTLEVSVDEGALPITPDMCVYTVGEAGNCTTDTEKSNNSKMTKQTSHSWFHAGQKKMQSVSWFRWSNVHFWFLRCMIFKTAIFVDLIIELCESTVPLFHWATKHLYGNLIWSHLQLLIRSCSTTDDDYRHWFEFTNQSYHKRIVLYSGSILVDIPFWLSNVSMPEGEL